ncbi:YecA family protein [Planctomycetota bacterium]
MRLSEDKIKEAILDTKLEFQQRAILYFAKSFSTDTSVMPLVIQAVETYGREDAYHLIGRASGLAQTEDTISWIIDELNNDQSDQYENYAFNLSRVLTEADTTLLLPSESAILDSLHLFPGMHAVIAERLQMLSWDEATCWQELKTFCEEGKDKQYINDVNLGYANHIVEALSRCGDQCEERVHAILKQTFEDYHDNPMQWMEPLMVRLAGEMQLESSIPMVIAKFLEDGGDLLNEECSRALIKIGGSTVVNAIAEIFTKAPHHFRLYASGVLENIHSDLSVDCCLKLLHQENDDLIQIYLATALLFHFSPKGIEEGRKLLLGRTPDFESQDLRNCLLETCAMMGQRFPEYDEWTAVQRKERKRHNQRIEELKDNPVGLLKYTFEKFKESKKESPDSSPTNSSQQAIAQDNQKVGRNAPCPCGRGRKFKKCCMNKSSGNPLLN